MNGKFVQLGSSMIVTLITYLAAFTGVWPSYAMTMLKSENSSLGYPITDFEGNIISSIPMLGSVISTFMTSYISDTIGRKKTQFLCALIFLVSWSLIATARTVTQIILGRLIAGFSCGIALVSVLVFISEITELSNRSSGTTIVSLLYNFGIFASYLEGWLISYDMISYSSVVVVIVVIICMTVLKESPTWLIKAGREEEALISLKFYRGATETTENILEELAYLKSQANSDRQWLADAEKPMLVKPNTQNTQEIKRNQDDSECKNTWIQLVTVDYNRRALLTLIMFMVLCIFTGMMAVQTYANQFFSKVVPGISPDLCSVMLAILMIFTCCISIAVTDLVSRRALMISTTTISTFCLATIGAAMRWSWIPVWMPPLVIVIFCVDFQLGMINIIFIQIAECFEPKVRSLGAAIIFSLMSVSNFLVIFIYGPMVEYFGIDGTFFIFAMICGLTSLLSYLFLKETRRIPLEDVQMMFAKGYLCTKL